MNQQAASRLTRQLRSEEDRLDALRKLIEVESFDTTTAREVIEDLVFVLETESNAYTILRLLEVLEQLAQDSPRTASKATVPVAKMLESAVREFEGDDVSENREVERLSNILEAILEETSPEEANFDIEYDDICTFLRQGDSKQRAIGYRLLGRTATGDSVRILLRDFSHEVETVRNARETGLRHTRSLVESALDSDESSGVATIDAFSELWAADRVDPDRRQLETVRQKVFTSVETLEEGETETLAGAIERLARQDEKTAEALVSEAFRALETGSWKRSATWAVLGASAKGAPEIVLRHADDIATRLERGVSPDTRSALEVVKVASRGVSSVPAVLASPILELTDSDDVEIARYAVETIGAMGFYPVPDRLSELDDRDRPSLSRVASQARKNLQRGHSVPGFASDLRSGNAEPSLFERDDGSVHLKVRTERGYWTDLSLGQFREGIVETTVQRVRQGEDVPINYPYYEPVDVVVLTLALVLRDAENDPQVGLYSPGSQSQWGTKGEIRDKLREFALADVSGEVISASPIPEVVPDAYVSEGRVKDNSEGDGPGRIVLTKGIPELTEVPDLDFALLNLTSKRKAETRENIEELNKSNSKTSVVTAHSNYTRNENEGRPRYGPPTGLESTPTVPGPDLVDSVLTRSDQSSASTRHESDVVADRTTNADVFGDDDWQAGDDDVRKLGQSKTVRIDHVETGKLAGLLDQLFEASASLFDTDAAGSGGLIFSRQMFFERLPIPPDDFDEWVRSRYEEGDRFVPPLVRERISDVEHKANTVEELEAVQPLNTAKRLLDRIHDELREHNPLFDKLKEYVTYAQQTGEALAIFSTSPKNAELLRDTLVKHDIVTREELESGKISVVSPDGAKKMKQHDKLLVFGSLHPEHAGFYVLPRVDETTVVTYDRTWETMIDRHASEFVGLLNDVVGETGYSPYAEPETRGDLPQDSDDDVTEREAAGDVPPTSVGTDEPSTKSKMEILESAMRSASATAYGESAGQYERELRRYLVVTEDGEKLRLTNREKVLRKSPTTSRGGNVHWINPDSLSVGDTLITIPDEIKGELWRDHIRSTYEEKVDADTAIEGVQTWYESLNEIWARAASELNSEGELSDGELYRRLYGWINEESEDFDRAFATVRGWFASAREADGPMDLVQNPSLVIGPQSALDIAAIGRGFGYDELIRDAEEIERAMKGFRTINRQEGHKYRDSIRESINSNRNTRVSETASFHEVEKITRVSDKPHQKSDDDETPGANEESHDGETSNDLDTQTVQRVVDIVELAPTSNSELCEAWGYDSGSELYQYLSSRLAEHYERNEDSLIVPTEKARELAREAADSE